MNTTLRLIREIATLLTVSGALSLLYNAFSPSPLSLVRTERLSAPDSLINALAHPTQLHTDDTTALTQSSAHSAHKPTPQHASHSSAALQEEAATPRKEQSASRTASTTRVQPISPSNSSSNPAPEPQRISQPAVQATALDIRIEQVEKLLANPDVLFIDARPSKEYQLGHIGNAINIYTPEFEQHIHRIVGLPRNKPIVAYCGGGACELSHDLAAHLIKLGFQHVFVYTGGWNEWKQRNP
ncbi:MAG: rhodanese-like domain-containing protein [Bacteroidota bacterium]|nr:rhodanese-like domain-containing protein [Candidatus Kapabacteria bacterium]MDW8219055.1 rhodanese-like domain-containing protein [Bacteroidota bacterium]